MDTKPPWFDLTKEAIKSEPNQTVKPKHVATNATLETTQSGYLYRDAKSAFRSAIKHTNEKQAHYWLAELCLSGEVKHSWNIILDMSIQAYSFVIPDSLAMLYRRVLRMKEKIDAKEPSDITTLHLLHDCVSILLWCRQQKSVIKEADLKPISKLKVPEDPRKYRKAPMDHLHPLIQGILSQTEDPPQLFAGGHEIVYAVERNDIGAVRFWLSWLIQWMPDKTTGQKRVNRIQVEKYQKDWIWGIWDIIFGCANRTRLEQSYLTLIKHCHALFSIQYTCGCRKKRFSLILLAFFLCMNHADTWKPIKLPNLPQRIQFGLGMKSFYASLKQTRQRKKPQQLHGRMG